MLTDKKSQAFALALIDIMESNTFIYSKIDIITLRKGDNLLWACGNTGTVLLHSQIRAGLEELKYIEDVQAISRAINNKLKYNNTIQSVSVHNKDKDKFIIILNSSFCNSNKECKYKVAEDIRSMIPSTQPLYKDNIDVAESLVQLLTVGGDRLNIIKIYRGTPTLYAYKDLNGAGYIYKLKLDNENLNSFDNIRNILQDIDLFSKNYYMYKIFNTAGSDYVRLSKDNYNASQIITILKAYVKLIETKEYKPGNYYDNKKETQDMNQPVSSVPLLDNLTKKVKTLDKKTVVTIATVALVLLVLSQYTLVKKLLIDTKESLIKSKNFTAMTADLSSAFTCLKKILGIKGGK